VCQKFEEFLKNIHILGRKKGRCLKLVKNHLLRHALFMAMQNNKDADIKISFAKAKPPQLKLVKYFGQIKE